MTLPNFLGIGAQRSGSTWLDVQLRSHADVYLPTRRKEVHFFDEYYDRGLGWYREFFPAGKRAARFRAVGEITPKYLYCPNAAARIHHDLPHCRLMAVLRNPADRAYSQYGLSVKNAGERRSFEEFLEARPEAFERGLYGRQLSRYFDLFPREKVLVLVFEQSIACNPQATLNQAAEFLQIDAAGFIGAGKRRAVGGSYATRFPRARSAASSLAQFLRRHDLDAVVNAAKAAGLPKLFGRRRSLPPINADTRARLLDRYETDIALVERLLGVDLSQWHEPRPAGDATGQRTAA